MDSEFKKRAHNLRNFDRVKVLKVASKVNNILKFVPCGDIIDI